MKKKISVIIISILLLALLAITASAAGLTATTDSKSCAKDGTVTLNVSLSSSVSVKSGAVEVVYDKTKLQLVEGVWNASGALLTNFDMNTEKGAFVYSSASSLSGRIFSVKFKVLSDAPLGETEVQCKIQLKDGSDQSVTLTNNSGKITITCNHNFTKKTTDYPASPASCTSAAKYYYSCTHCGEKGTTTYTVGNPTSHTYDKQIATEDYLVSSVTCDDTAEFYYSCVCGAKGSEKFEGDASFSHSYSESWLIGKDGHWHGCSDCGKKKDYSAHDGATCSVCSFITDGGHFHEFGSSYKKDENGHWNECGCGEKQNLTLHTWDAGVVTKAATLTAEGERKLTCTACGYVKTESIAKLVQAPSTGSGANTQTSAPAEGTNTVLVIVLSVAATLVVEAIAFAIIRATKNKSSKANTANDAKAEQNSNTETNDE